MDGKQIALISLGVFGAVLIMPLPIIDGIKHDAGELNGSQSVTEGQQPAEGLNSRQDLKTTPSSDDTYTTALAVALHNDSLTVDGAMPLIRAAYCNTSGQNAARSAADTLVKRIIGGNPSLAEFKVLNQAVHCIGADAAPVNGGASPTHSFNQQDTLAALPVVSMPVGPGHDDAGHTSDRHRDLLSPGPVAAGPTLTQSDYGSTPSINGSQTVILNRAGGNQYSGSNGGSYTQAGPRGVVNNRTGQFIPTN